MFGAHKRLIHSYEVRLAEQSSLYEARIAELKHQVSNMEKLVFSPTSASKIPVVALEADAIFSQKDETIEIGADEMAKIEEIESEANRILSGNY